MRKLFNRTCVSSLALLLALVTVDVANGQAPVPPAQPLWKVDPLGQGAILASPCADYEDRNGPLLVGNPLLDGPVGAPGIVAGAELDIIVPHVINRVFGSVTRASGVTDTVQLPFAEPGVRAMPKFELGYRWGQASGEVIASYRFVDSDVTHQFSGADLPAFAPAGGPVRSRLDLQVFDLDYGSHEPITVLDVDMKWRAGLRSVIWFADSQANNGTLFQHTTDHYWGLGPHALVDFRRPIRGTGFGLFGRIEGAMPFGRLVQRFVEAVTVGGITDSGQTDVLINSEIATVAFQAGVSWTPTWNQNFHVTAGYVYEHFFALGTTTTPPSPSEEFYLQGGFLRAEWNY
jgi:hypothetical protein